ncbi:MAG: hypothetical protein H6726_28925 [Sandaracinaceae bacterium]|nr:hypothetical protein [Sandaracinaceae bacterium]
MLTDMPSSPPPASSLAVTTMRDCPRFTLRRGRMALCALMALWSGCGSSAPLAPTESPAGAEASAQHPSGTSGDPMGEPADANAEPAATDAAPVADSEPPSGADEPVEASTAPTEPIQPIDMTPAAAPALCADLVDDPDLVRSCAFLRGGVTLPEAARADVLEFVVDDTSYGETRRAYLVVRTPGVDYTTTRELGEAYDIPGSSVGYRLGRLQRTAQGVRIQVTLTDETFAYTGEPGVHGPRDVETVRAMFVCTRQDDGYYDCDRD